MRAPHHRQENQDVEEDDEDHEDRLLHPFVSETRFYQTRNKFLAHLIDPTLRQPTEHHVIQRLESGRRRRKVCVAAPETREH